MTLGNLVRGLQIIAKYAGDGYCMAAEHDQVWAGTDASAKNDMTPEDVAELEAIDWNWDEDVGSWMAFV